MRLGSAENPYFFEFDDNLSLKRVVLPSGAVYGVVRYLGVGFVRTTIKYNDMAVVDVDETDRGNILSTYYPGQLNIISP